MANQVKLIVGLGNPGPEYQMTRHNAGFWFLDALAGRLSLAFNTEKKFQTEVCRFQQSNTDCRLAKPQTFMNESGSAVQAMLNFYKLELSQILVVHDEIDLEPGTIRFKIGGGHGGHNGLRDIIQKTGANNFNRLRIGVGHPGSKDRVISSVLGRPSKQDEDKIINAIVDVIEQRDWVFAGEIEKLMNQFNQKK